MFSVFLSTKSVGWTRISWPNKLHSRSAPRSPRAGRIEKRVILHWFGPANLQIRKLGDLTFEKCAQCTGSDKTTQLSIPPSQFVHWLSRASLEAEYSPSDRENILKGGRPVTCVSKTLKFCSTRELHISIASIKRFCSSYNNGTSSQHGYGFSCSTLMPAGGY